MVPSNPDVSKPIFLGSTQKLCVSSEEGPLQGCRKSLFSWAAAKKCRVWAKLPICGTLGWPKISKILKSISLPWFYENMDPTDEENANRNVWWCISTLLKHHALYKENIEKYKGKY